MIPFGTGNTDINPSIDTGIAEEGGILIYDISRNFWEGSNRLKVSPSATTFYNDAGSSVGFINNNGFNGVGSQLTGLNASSISSGTVDNARLPSSIYRTLGAFSSVGTSSIFAARTSSGALTSPPPDDISYVSDNHTFKNYAEDVIYATLGSTGLTINNSLRIFIIQEEHLLQETMVVWCFIILTDSFNSKETITQSTERMAGTSE